jgi:hypothetical protein
MESPGRVLTALTAGTVLLGGTVASVGVAAAATPTASAGAQSAHGRVLSPAGLHRSVAGTAIGSAFSGGVFTSSGPAGSTGPDDMTTMGGDIFIAYQNGVGPMGQPATSGATKSTLVQYHRDGYQVASWSLTGKIDGLTADPANNRLVATVNEDGNSSLYTIHPSAAPAAQVVHLTYVIPPSVQWGGGSDAPRVFNGSLYITASAPNPAPAAGNIMPALVKAVIDETAGTVTLSAAFIADGTTQLASDPDSNNVVPASAAKYGGSFVLDGQGDSQLYFISNPGPGATAQTLPITTQVDDIEFATASTGTLYVVDSGTNKVVSVSGAFTPGTAFVAVPSGSTVQSFVGQLDLTTGNITPIIVGLSSPKGLLFVPGPPAAGPYGYRLTAADGGTFNFGDSAQLGSLGSAKLNKPIVGAASTPDRLGQYLVGSDGGVFTFGTATFKGSLGATGSPSPAVGIAATSGGYWIAAANGTVTAYGTAPVLGSLTPPPSPVVGIAPTPDGGGYWLTTATGAVFPFGDAKPLGDISARKLNAPVVSITSSPDGLGYWLTASDGGVFAFGDAPFVGSAGGLKLNKPVVAIIPTASGKGYQLVASDGGVFAYGDAAFFGSTGALKLNQPVVAASS